MSVTFSVMGIRPDYVSGEGYVNMSNTNARDILSALGLDYEDLCGDMRGRDFRKLCESALAKSQPGDEPRAIVITRSPIGGTFIECGREDRYVTTRLQQLLEVAKSAGDIGVVAWG